jgi:1,4-dihydroxy-2-naphthoyl-CoA hydrolase
MEMKSLDFPFLEFLNVETEKLDREEVILTLNIKESLKQHLGFLHGGVIATLAENAGLMVIELNLPEDKHALTAELNVNYLKAAAKGVVRAVAKPLKIGRTLCVAEIKIYNRNNRKERLVAHATGIYAVIQRNF